MDFNLDVLKTFRETVDWLIEKYKAASDYDTKKQLNKIANQISRLAVNKAAYLSTLKEELNSNKENIDLSKIHYAIRVAEEDTGKLRELLNEVKFETAEVSFSFKYNLEKLTKLKEIKLTELKELVSKEVLSSQETEKVISGLESFEQKWIELGKEIDALIR